MKSKINLILGKYYFYSLIRKIALNFSLKETNFQENSKTGTKRQVNYFLIIQIKLLSTNRISLIHLILLQFNFLIMKPIKDQSIKENSKEKEFIKIKIKFFLKAPILIISSLKEFLTTFLRILFT